MSKHYRYVVVSFINHDNKDTLLFWSNGAWCESLENATKYRTKKAAIKAIENNTILNGFVLQIWLTDRERVDGW